jgi:hypothetical protein
MVKFTPPQRETRISKIFYKKTNWTNKTKDNKKEVNDHNIFSQLQCSVILKLNKL